MATTGRADEGAPTASDVAASCRDAALVSIVGAPDGDALAALGVLARALDDAGIAFHARIESAGSAAAGGTEADCRLAIGFAETAADHAIVGDGERSSSERARAIAAEIADPEPDPALALAGRIAAGHDAVGSPLASEFERRPGLGLPTADLADGLGHSTLVHAPFSGDREATTAALADIDLPDGDGEDAGRDSDDGQRVASLLALAVAGDEEAPSRAATAVERALRPHVGGPVETIEGYADVLDALARTRPGLGIAVAIGAAEASAGEAFDAWREHGRRVHGAVRDADVERRDGLAVARVEGVGSAAIPVARLLRDFRLASPAVLVLGEEYVALATTERGPDAASTLSGVADDGESGVHGDARLAGGRTEDESALVGALEEAT